jgi:hypothetical protein
MPSAIKNGDNSPSHTRHRHRRLLERPLTHQDAVIPREVVSPQSFLPFHHALLVYTRTTSIEHQAIPQKIPGVWGLAPTSASKNLRFFDLPYCLKSRPSLSPETSSLLLDAAVPINRLGPIEYESGEKACLRGEGGQIQGRSSRGVVAASHHQVHRTGLP